jgi:localization factor PodJL
MKTGGPWNLRGLRPEARAAARKAARRSGMSVGEWLNTVIRPAEEPDAEPAWSADFDRKAEDRPAAGRRRDKRDLALAPEDFSQPGPRRRKPDRAESARRRDRDSEDRWETISPGDERVRDRDGPSRRREPERGARRSLHGDERKPSARAESKAERQPPRGFPEDQRKRSPDRGAPTRRHDAAPKRQRPQSFRDDAREEESPLVSRDRVAARERSRNDRARQSFHDEGRKPKPDRPAPPSRRAREPENERPRKIRDPAMAAARPRKLRDRESAQERPRSSRGHEQAEERPRSLRKTEGRPDRDGPQRGSLRGDGAHSAPARSAKSSGRESAAEDQRRQSVHGHEPDRERRVQFGRRVQEWDDVRGGSAARDVRERSAPRSADLPEPGGRFQQNVRNNIDEPPSHPRPRADRQPREPESADRQWDSFSDEEWNRELTWDADRSLDDRDSDDRWVLTWDPDEPQQNPRAREVTVEPRDRLQAGQPRPSAGRPYRDAPRHQGSPYRAEPRQTAIRPQREPEFHQRRDERAAGALPQADRDAAVDRAIAEITVRQRALDREAAIETARRRALAAETAAMAARQRPPAVAAETTAPQRAFAGEAPPARAAHAPAEFKAPLPAPAGPAVEMKMPQQPFAAAVPPEGMRPPPAQAGPPQAPASPVAAVPAAPQPTVDPAIVAAITARQHILDDEAAAAVSARQQGREIAAQRALYGDIAADILAEQSEGNDNAAALARSEPPRLPASATDKGRAPSNEGARGETATFTFDLGGLERQLRHLTTRIETLRPASDLEAAINELRPQLADISHSLTGVQPRRALEPIEIEIKALAERIDRSRQSGVDSGALAGIERGLAEVREALRNLTPAERLVGLEDAVGALARKVDAIVARDDPEALQQLETAIGALRGLVSHIASNDTLTRVAEDVRALALKVDDLAKGAKNAPSLVALEDRVDALASALNASTEAGYAVPRELEKLLSGLIDKLEWVQLTHTDHTALAHLEDRIATLVKRLDASDSRLGLLEGVERGLADLLVYIEQLRSGNGVGEARSGKPAAADQIEHKFVEIQQSERRTQDSLEAVQGTVEHVVDRLARIESDLRLDRAWSETSEPGRPQTQDAPALSPIETPALSATFDALAGPDIASSAGAAARPAAARSPIDPNLPPDHPLEPSLAAGRTRRPASPSERIAAIGAKPAGMADPSGGKADFIAAARRAAQAAVASTPNDKASEEAVPGSPSKAKKLTDRLRTLFVAASVVVIVVGGFRVVSRLFDNGSRTASAPAQMESAPRVLAEPPPQTTPPAQMAPTQAEPPIRTEPPRVQIEAPAASAANTTNVPKAIAVPVPDADAAPKPGAAAPAAATPGASGSMSESQSLLNATPTFGAAAGVLAEKPATGATAAALAAWSAPDVTGSVPHASGHNSANGPATGGDKLPIAIGGPALRAAALAGDPSAAYEVGVRFAEGRSVPQNDEEAAHWFEIAAKKGLVPAQFRLGTLYEKGLGVKKDLPAALDLYRAAADKGHGKAMHNLAVLYAEGAAGTADYRTASQWFRKAAELGVTDSQYNLAVLYARGVGVEQNFGESFKWFYLAAKQGDRDAAQKRDEVAGRLDQPGLAAARLAAEQWSPVAQPADAVAVKASDSWDAPAKAAASAKPKSRAAAKVPTPDAARVD